MDNDLDCKSEHSPPQNQFGQNIIEIKGINILEPQLSYYSYTKETKQEQSISIRDQLQEPLPLGKYEI